jgi:hypothetical protein
VADPLAVYGAAIGTAAAAGAAWNIYAGWRDRAVLVLSCTLGSTVGGPGVPAVLDQNFLVEVWNHGRRPKQVTSAGLLLEDKSMIAMMVDPTGQAVLPAVLDERRPNVTLSTPVHAQRSRFSQAGAAKPTHIFCFSAGKRRTRRLSPESVRFLTSATVDGSDQSLDRAAGGTSDTPAG